MHFNALRDRASRLIVSTVISNSEQAISASMNTESTVAVSEPILANSRISGIHTIAIKSAKAMARM